MILKKEIFIKYCQDLLNKQKLDFLQLQRRKCFFQHKLHTTPKGMAGSKTIFY